MPAAGSDGSVKKCTAFIRRLKTPGSYSAGGGTLYKDMAKLRLHKYMEEVVQAIAGMRYKTAVEITTAAQASGRGRLGGSCASYS